MRNTDARVTTIVARVAVVVAAMVALVLPAAHWVIAYSDYSNQLAFKAEVKAAALGGLITSSPRTWMFAESRLQGLLAREPVPLETEVVRAFGERGELLAQAGEDARAPVMSREAPVYDAGRLAGRIQVSDSMRGMIGTTALAALAGLLLGGLVYIALRTLPLRALRRVTTTLFKEKQRAETTLRSIGDGVITTNAAGLVDFMNPVAERLSGWSFPEAAGKHINEVLRVHDCIHGGAIDIPMTQALAEDRIVSFGRDVDLRRRDGSSIGIDDSAAPIHGEDGHIAGGVLVFRDVSAARALTQQQSWEATHDVLTGLVNRREFESLVEVAVGTARNAGKQHVVCYLDLDQFKVVNDTAGHAAGDALLKELASVMQARIRGSDTLARLGGDEFGVLLEGCSLDRSRLIAADLLAAAGDFRFNWEAKPFTIGVSIGLAAVTAETTSGPEVLSMADTACYWAKEQGRNRVCVYRTGDSDMAARRRETGWIARIKAALEQDRFVLYHQAYLPLSDGAGATRHIEVLLRMVDEEGGIVLPGSFLPAAERYNLMPTIDRWVIRTVFARYGELLAQQPGVPLTCAINLSGTSLNSEDFIDFVRALSLEHGLPRHSICFEITETAAINNLRRAAEFITECKSMGFLFALDDFGTGTSSFGYLRNLPVDYLKIDGGFVKNIEHDAMDKAMTETINRIGHIMGIKTVAEFAESEAVIAQLRTIGVDYAQGFGFCRPSPLFAPAPAAA